MQHEKKKMTRKEAIDSLQKHCTVNDPGAIIDFYMEAGMLEIVEEEGPGIPIGFKFPFSKRQEYTEIFDALAKQGFDVIKR